MSESVVHGRLLGAHCEMVDVTQGTVPDETWSYVDPAGHLHLWIEVGGQLVVPTTKVIIDQPGSDDDDDVFIPALTHLECTGCGAVVEPAWRTPTQKVYAVGVKHFTLDGESISVEEAAYFRRTGRRLPPYEDLERLRGRNG